MLETLSLWGRFFLRLWGVLRDGRPVPYGVSHRANMQFLCYVNHPPEQKPNVLHLCIHSDIINVEVVLMAKTATLNVRIDPSTKADAERLFSSFGITISDAVNIFIHQSLMVGGLPFEMKQPRYNAATEAAMREARLIAEGKVQAETYHSVQELREALDIEC